MHNQVDINIMWVKIVTLLVLALVVAAGVFPPPKVERYTAGELSFANVCDLFHFPSQHPLIQSGYYFGKVLKRLNKNVECPMQLTYNKEKHIKLASTETRAINTQGYQILVDENGVQINYSDYAGYVYALESLSQVIKDGKIPYLFIQDEPLLQYRGIMIDSARHYLGVASIKRLIQSMALSKLNILHWHMVDDESFPVILVSHPELAEGGKYSDGEVYTKQDIIDIIAVAQNNAVQIVPEIDTPAHVRAWGESTQWKAKNISIHCGGGTGYNGQFDVSIPQVFTLAQDVVRQIATLFKASPYLHLGGDEVSSACWNLRPEIQNFMKNKNISSYGELQMYWRAQIKAVLQPNRKVMFWRNDGKDVTTSDGDILHYWGSQTDVAKITANTTSQIVLSPSDILYLNKGQGNLWLNASQGEYAVWRNIYQNFTVFPQGVDRSRILGAEACLWGEVSNEDTLENNLWMRATAFASRVWSQKILNTYEIVGSLVQMQYALYGMDVDASPVTSEFCEHKPKVCFPPPAVQVNESVNIIQM